jgi:ribosome recycling factor
MLPEITAQTKDRMDKAVVALQEHLSKLRTGRASLTMLDGIRVDYYGTPTPLNQIATMGTPEPRLITIQPWEANLIPAIEKAIDKANIGLTPSNDGKIVRLPVPQLTEERRKDIVKQIKTFGEDCRVAVRHSRREANEAIKTQQKAGKITEDDLKKGEKDIQKLTDDAIAKVDQIVTKKEQDIMKV